MPVVSKKEAAWMRVNKGGAWMKKHHFDNPTKDLPVYAKGTAGNKKRKRKY
jgi:hypothetical protein